MARRLIFSVLASLSRAGGRKSGGTKKASSSPAGHLKYLNAQNNKLENFCGPDNLYAPKELSERDTTITPFFVVTGVCRRQPGQLGC